MSAHAKLSPSAASRWLVCTPSAQLESGFPDRAGEAAAEGTLAHTLGELLIRQKLGWVSAKEYQAQLAPITTEKWYNKSFHDYCDDYAEHVLERYNEARTRNTDAKLFLEEKIDLSRYVPEGFGTGDAVIIADAELDVNDFKFGSGVPVSAIENRQMMLYALGALDMFEHIYDIQRVRMTIYQPRINNNSTYLMDADELRAWGEQELIPRARLAFDGAGEYVAGAHCRFCRARAVCKANAAFNLATVREDFAAPQLLTDDEVADVLKRADLFYKWLEAVEQHALYEAVNNGKNWPGFKLVQGRSVRKYEDPEKIADKLTSLGYQAHEIYKAPELVALSEMEKLLGKKTFAAELNDLIIKPDGKPTLAPLDDKRPAYHSAEAAKLDFAEELDT